MNTNLLISDEMESTSGFFERYLDKFLDLIFSLTSTAGNIRSIFLLMLFFGIWLILSLVLNSPGDKYISLFPFLDPGLPQIFQTLNHLLGLMFSWNVIILMSAILTGIYIALHITATYLADIFDLDKLSIAQNYLKQTAFSTLAFKCIHIENGMVRDEDQSSPIIRIGGPGCVQINLENAVVFEKINGKPRICGPTINENVFLEGFERIRKIIDLRDHTTSFNINSRTRDGIRMSISDIRLLFSVYRDDSFTTITNPYTYKEESLYWLVYRHGSSSWTASLINLVRNELADFISQHSLSEILAAVGEPEIARQINYQNNIGLRMRVNRAHSRRYKIYRNCYPSKKTDGPDHLPIYFKTKKHLKRANLIMGSIGSSIQKINFSHRNQISKLFYKEFSNSFYQRAKNQGVKLNWINVGTWYSPGQLVAEQHLEAWKIISQNEINSNPKVLAAKLENQRLISLADHIRQLPIHSFIMLEEKKLSDLEIKNRMIDEYASKLKLGRALFLRSKGRVPIQIENALHHIRKHQINNLHKSGYFIGEGNHE
jgi:hypothetical protein